MFLSYPLCYRANKWNTSQKLKVAMVTAIPTTQEHSGNSHLIHPGLLWSQPCQPPRVAIVTAMPTTQGCYGNSQPSTTVSRSQSRALTEQHRPHPYLLMIGHSHAPLPLSLIGRQRPHPRGREKDRRRGWKREIEVWICLLLSALKTSKLPNFSKSRSCLILHINR